MDQRFERIVSTQRALWLLRKFESLKLPNLGIQDKYQRILNHYARDIEMVSKIYQKNKTDPPVARDLPPIAGEFVAYAQTTFKSRLSIKTWFYFKIIYWHIFVTRYNFQTWMWMCHMATITEGALGVM